MADKSITAHVAKRIKHYRELKGLTQEELGKMVGVKHNTISAYESGINRPDMDILYKIAKALDVSIDDLFPPIKYASYIISNKKESLNKVHTQSQIPTIGDFMVNAISEDIVYVPVVGHISCGGGTLVYDDIETYEPIPKRWAKGGEYFCLRAKGDSMTGARIHEGDLLLIRKQPEVENGEIAAVMIENEVVLKRVYRSDGQLILQSENPKYPPIVVPPAEAKVVGKLKKIIITP